MLVVATISFINNNANNLTIDIIVFRFSLGSHLSMWRKRTVIEYFPLISSNLFPSLSHPFSKHECEMLNVTLDSLSNTNWVQEEIGSLSKIIVRNMY